VNLPDVYSEVGAALKPTGLRVYEFGVNTATAPAVLFDLPLDMEFDTTFARGADRFTLPIRVIVGKVDARASFDAILGYTSGSGDKSVKAAVESGTYTTLDSIRVTTADLGILTLAGVDYLGATFNLDIIGQGN
jgi:hypothetical protein